MTSQQALIDNVLPYLLQHGKKYQKTTRVKARLAVPGEEISSVTGDGLETKNKAGTGDFVVENATAAKERYIIKEESFHKKYTKDHAAEQGWDWYIAKGKIIAIEITGEVLQHFGWQSPVYFEAPWKESMVVKDGDFLVTPLPDKNEIYRIARTEFFETYALIEAV